MRDIRNIDLNLMFVLQVLLQECNVSRAAERLSLTQPTVSGMLSRLRHLFGDPLFIRSSHGMEPTAYALGLKPKLDLILSDIDDLMQVLPFDPAQSTETVVISATDYMQYVFLVPAVKRLLQLAPHMRIAVVPPEIPLLYEKLLHREIDLAVSIPEFTDPRLREETVYVEDYVAVIRKDHPRVKRRLTLKTFLALEHAMVSPTNADFTGPTDQALEHLGVSRRVTTSVSSFFTLVELVAQTDHIALLPRRLAAKFSDRLRLLEPPVEVPTFEVTLVWHPRTDSDPVRQWLASSLASIGHQL